MRESSGWWVSGCVWIFWGRPWCTRGVGGFYLHTAKLCLKQERKEGSVCQGVVMSIPGSVFSPHAREGRLGGEWRAGVHHAHPLPAHALLER